MQQLRYLSWIPQSSHAATKGVKRRLQLSQMMANFCLSPFGPPFQLIKHRLCSLHPAVPAAAVASKFLPTSAFPMTASAALLTFHRCNRQRWAWRFGVNGPCTPACCWRHRFADFHAVRFYFIRFVKEEQKRPTSFYVNFY